MTRQSSTPRPQLEPLPVWAVAALDSRDAALTKVELEQDTVTLDVSSDAVGLACRNPEGQIDEVRAEIEEQVVAHLVGTPRALSRPQP